MRSGPASPRTWSSASGAGTPALVRSGGLLLEGVEDEADTRDLERRRRAVRPAHDPVGADHDERAGRDAVVLDPDAELARDRALGVEVREQRDREPEMALEGLVRVRGVDGDAVEPDAAYAHKAFQRHLGITIPLE